MTDAADLGLAPPDPAARLGLKPPQDRGAALGLKPPDQPGLISRVNTALNRAVAPVGEAINRALAPVREGAPPGSLPPEAASARGGATITTPSEDIDGEAVFNQRKALGEKLKAAGKRPSQDPEYQELSRKLSQLQTQHQQMAATMAVPAERGIAGLVERATAPKPPAMAEVTPPKAPVEPAPQMTPKQKIDRIAELQAERGAAARGERVYGSPAQSFQSIASGQKAPPPAAPPVGVGGAPRAPGQPPPVGQPPVPPSGAGPRGWPTGTQTWAAPGGAAQTVPPGGRGQPPAPPNIGAGAAAPRAPGQPPPHVAWPIPPNSIIDNLKRWFTPAARGESAKLTEGIAREALGKREMEFQQNAELLRSFGNEVGKMPPADRFAFIDAIETGNLGQYQGHPIGQLAGEIRKLFDDRWQKMDARGIAPGYVQDYFPHLWQDPSKAANTFAQMAAHRPLAGGKRFTRERTFATLAEGMKSGLVPVTDNPIELTLTQLQQMDKYITAQDIVTEMEHTGLAVPVDTAHQPPPAGWVRIDDQIARRGGRTLFAPEPAATIINRELSPGLSGQPAYDAARTAGNMLNAAQLGFSGFHAAFVTMDAAVSSAAKGVKQISRLTPGEIGRGIGSIAKSAVAPVMNYLSGRKVLMQYLDRGQYGPQMAKIVDALIAGGGRARMDSFYRSSAAGNFWQSFRGSLQRLGVLDKGPGGGRMTLGQDLAEMFRNAKPITTPMGQQIAPGVVRAAAQLVPRVMDTIMAPLFEDIVPKMKLGVFFDLMSDELRVNPAMSQVELRQVAGRLWNSVDNRLGQLAYDNLFWNRTMKDIGHISVRSLGWNLGTIREIAGGALDLAEMPVTGRIEAGAMKQITDRASYVIAMPLVGATAGALYGYLKTGQGPQEIRDYFFPKTGGKDAQGGPERVSMPGYIKDVVEWVNHPLNTATGKIHPLLTSVLDMLQNQDFYGGSIRNPNDPIGKQVTDFSRWLVDTYTPLSLRRAPGAPQSNISGPESFLGIRQAPYFIREPQREENYERRVLQRKVVKRRREDARQ